MLLTLADQTGICPSFFDIMLFLVTSRKSMANAACNLVCKPRSALLRHRRWLKLIRTLFSLECRRIGRLQLRMR